MADFDTTKTVSVIITPSGGDQGGLSAADFVKQIDALRELILLSGLNGDSAPQITRLEMNSPALVVFEAKATSARFEKFFADLETVANNGTAPPLLSRSAFDILKNFASPIGKGVGAAKICLPGREIVIDVAARKRIESAFGNDSSSEGTVDGMLEVINVHGKKNAFALYPVIGAKRVTCTFEDHLLDKVRPALGKYVEIKGELKYRWREKFPFEAYATDISVMPEWEEQPSFVDIIGMAPNATGGEQSEEFTLRRRHGW